MQFRYSAVSCSYYCPKKYELQYVKDLTEPTKSLDLAFGSAVHAGINAHFEGGDAVAAFEMSWAMVGPEYEKGRFDHAQLLDIGAKLLTKWVRMHAPKYEPQYVEQTLNFMLGGYRFSGTPDFIGTFDGKVCVVDWKTSGYRYDKRKPAVDEQLWVYAEACYQNYGFYPENLVYAVFVKDGASVQTPIVYPFSKEKHKTMIANVTEVVRDLATRERFPMNRQNCLKCGFYNHCYAEGETA